VVSKTLSMYDLQHRSASKKAKGEPVNSGDTGRGHGSEE